MAAATSGLEPIAIVGVGCRFAGGANSAKSFWQLLSNGVDANREVPRNRWNIDALFDADAKVRKGKMYTRRGGFLDDITRFDPMAFGISPREAHAMDPQQRLLLEVTHEAFEDAGIPASKYQGSETGVYVGLMNHDYAMMQDGTSINNFSSPGTASSIASNRLSFAFDLKGPSLTIDTACSSSLVGAHFASASLRCGETDMAVVGGVNVMASPILNIALSRIGMLSPDGRCKAFDASGDGYGRGEGAGVVILKRLSDAVRDGDQVYCTLLGSSVNSDGRGSTPITAPNQAMQERMLHKAYRMAGVAPSDVQYMEAHGTGTLRGDPIEAGALGAVLGAGRPAAVPLAMGSVKTNIGHVEAGAGVAGLIKVCLSMKHSSIPPSLHFKNPNPLIDFDKLRMRVVTTLEPWPETHGRPKLAGVNSFGFGGTNSHAVLQQPPAGVDRAAPWGPRDADTAASDVLFSLPISAHTKDALVTMASQYAAAIRSSPARVVDLAYTAATRRSRHKLRVVAMGATHEELATALERYAADPTAPTSSLATGSASADMRVGFAFSGSGTAWPRMGRQLMASYPAFAATIRELDATLARSRFSGVSIATELARPDGESRLKDLRVCQACIYAVQVALVDLLRSWGVTPTAVVGHSIGEVAAAVTAGLMTRDEGLLLVMRLGHFAHSVSGNGYMVTAATSAETALEVIGADLANYAGVAAVNDGANVTLAGTTDAMDTVCQRLAARGITSVRVALGAPFHTVAVQQYQRRYMDEFADLPTRRTADRDAAAPHFFSTCRIGASTVDATASAGLSMDASYFWDNARNTVQFAPVVSAVTSEQGIKAWVEVGPTASLAVSLTALAKGVKGSVVVPAMRIYNDGPSFVAAAAQLFSAGVEVTWASQYEDARPRMAELPLYPWNHSVSYWMESRNHYCHRVGTGLPQPLLGLFHPLGVCDDSVVYEADISTESLPLLEDHVYQKSLLLPATMYMEICLAMGRRLLGPDTPFSLHSLDLPQAMWFARDEVREVRVTAVRRRAGTADGDGESKGRDTSASRQQSGGAARDEDDDFDEDDAEYYVTVTSRRKKAGSDDAQGAVTQHSSCVIRAGAASSYTDVEAVEFAEVTALQERGEVIPHEQWYSNFQAVGFDFGSRFRNIKQAWKAIPTAVGEITVGELIQAGMGEYLFHPGILDAAGQVLDATVSKESSIPVNIGRVTVHKPLDADTMRSVLSYARMTRRTEEEATGKKFVLGDVFLFTASGELLLTLADFACQVLDPTQTVSRVNSADDSVYAIEYQPAPLPAAEATSVPGNSLVIMPRGAVCMSRGDLSTLVGSLGAHETPRRCMTVEQDSRTLMSADELQRLIVDNFSGAGAKGSASGANRRRRRRRGASKSSVPQLKRIVLLFHDGRDFDDDASDAAHRCRVASNYLAGTILHVSQAVSAVYSRFMSQAPWVYFVTCGAVAPAGPATGLPSLMSAVHSSAHGFRRTLAHEFPSLRLRNFDMGVGGRDAAASASKDVAALVDELGSRMDDEEVAVRGGQRYVARYTSVPQEQVSREQGAAFTCRPDGTYVIIGGCRGLGLKLAGLLKQRGARTLVLVSRSGVAPANAAEVDKLAADGCKVIVSKTDVTDADAVQRLFRKLSSQPSTPPVRGVVHSAMVLDDGLVLSQTSRRVERVMGPKVMGGMLLHLACRGMDLDFFCLFSSTTALFGNQGQFSYGGANAFLDGLAHLRHRQGVAGVSVNWGAFKGIGYLARNTSVEKQLQQRGWEGIDEPTFYDFFTRFNASSLPQTSLALADLAKWFRHQPWALTSPMYASMAAKAKAAMAAADNSGGAASAQLLAKLQNAGDSDALPVIVAWARGVIAMSLDVEAEEVDVDASFPQLGVDSLMGMEVRNVVAEQLQVDMPLALMFGNTTVSSLADFLLQQVRQMAPPDADTTDAATTADAPQPGAGAGAGSAPAPAPAPLPSDAAKVAHVPDSAPQLGAADAAKAAAQHLPYAPHAPVSGGVPLTQAPMIVQAVTVEPVRTKPASPPSPPSPVQQPAGRAVPSVRAVHRLATTPSHAGRLSPSASPSTPSWATLAPAPAPVAAPVSRVASGIAPAASARVAASSSHASPLSWNAPTAEPTATVVPSPASAVRAAAPSTVPVEVLTAWLSRAMAVKSRSSPLPKYSYPSPGALHPVQIYVVVPPRDTSLGMADGASSRVDGVPSGRYYYHPVEHSLYALRAPKAPASAPTLSKALTAACPDHASGSAPSPFFAVLVGDMAAIEPLYGKAARPFLFFEAGALTRVLKEGGAAASTPLHQRPVAMFDEAQQTALVDALDLKPSHVLLRAVFVTL